MQPELPAVIGIAGAKRTGKDTLAQFLVERHGYERHAFADPLKELALRDDRWVYVDPAGTAWRMSDVINQWGWEIAKDEFPEVRRTLQFLGTEVVRSVKPSHWIDLMDYLLLQANLDGRKIVVPDVRFENEASLIRQWGGTVVEIQRPSLRAPLDSHVSEARIEGDFVLLNDSTPERLYQGFLGAVS
jgi:hypothetical protein